MKTSSLNALCSDSRPQHKDRRRANMMRPRHGGRNADDYLLRPGARVFAFFKPLSCLTSPGALLDLPLSPEPGVTVC